MAAWLMAERVVSLLSVRLFPPYPPPAVAAPPLLSHTAEMAFPGPVGEHTATFTSSLASRTPKGTSVPFYPFITRLAYSDPARANIPWAGMPLTRIPESLQYLGVTLSPDGQRPTPAPQMCSVLLACSQEKHIPSWS